jgi:glycosyltransferase involved in cell wall biosynthesis
MSRLIGSLEPDILITYNWGAIEWAMFNRLFARRKHIHLEDGFGPDEADQQKRRRVITRRLMLRRSTVVVPSRTLRNIAVGQWRLKAERVIYIPNGIDSARFDRPSTKEAKPFSSSAQRDGECVIGTFSPLRPEKNIGRMLRAFAEIRVPSRRLVVCGDGPELPKLREIAKRLALEEVVTFAGHVQKPEEIMGAFDLFAITSDTEQMPYAVLEAMSARLPVVGTAVGDIPIMVAEENRPYIVPRDSHAALAAALQRLCVDVGLRRKLGVANRSRVDRDFGLAQMTKAFSRLLQAS